jgi:hypothetical protein
VKRDGRTDGRMDGQKWMKMATRYDERKNHIFFLFVCFVYPFGNNSKTNGADRSLGEKKLKKKTNKTKQCCFLKFCLLLLSQKKKLIKKNGAKNTHYHSPTKKQTLDEINERLKKKQKRNKKKQIIRVSILFRLCRFHRSSRKSRSLGVK